MKKYHTDELFGCNVRIADEQRWMVHITDCTFPKVPHYCQGLRSAEENNLKSLFMCQDRLQTKILSLKQPVFLSKIIKHFSMNLHIDYNHLWVFTIGLFLQ